MKRIIALLFIFSALNVSANGQLIEVANVRVWQAPDNLRLVFDITGPVEHSLFILPSPERVVVDLRNTKLSQLNLDDDVLAQSWMKGLRAAARNGTDTRVVLDMKRRVRPKSFILKPNAQYGYRLVLDLHDESLGAQSQQANPPAEVIKRAEVEQGQRDIIIAVDAGHGGEDPGAIGKRGTYEKAVVLDIAKRLAKLINDTHGMKAVLTRDGDYFIPLRDRVKRAREMKADLMISIHADSIKNPNIAGASVYALSQRGATSEAARWLAESENASDMVGGVKLDDKDDVLASVLLDLSQTATIDASLDLGTTILKEIDAVSKLHRVKVEQAEFVVLKSPDIPSLLVETAFISNPTEERNLKSGVFQDKMARAILRGIQKFFYHNPPPGTLLAYEKKNARTHVISEGETLSSIAQRYHVSLATLRSTNNLKSDQIRVGDTLNIPNS